MYYGLSIMAEFDLGSKAFWNHLTFLCNLVLNLSTISRTVSCSTLKKFLNDNSSSVSSSLIKISTLSTALFSISSSFGFVSGHCVIFGQLPRHFLHYCKFPPNAAASAL